RRQRQMCIRDRYKYEDIMINLDELMINHKQNTEYEGKIKAAMKERQNTLQYKRQDTIESLSVEFASLGIFDALDANDIRKLITKVVENKPIDSDYNTLKLESIQQVIALNGKKKEQKSKNSIRNVNLLPLLKLREQALLKKKHSYELLTVNG
ncbi:ATP-binding protein, partial [Bacillus paranthracis]|nr:ATP-binding protein [Bacillus paranthracis]